MKSIRMSEMADRWSKVGVHRTAIEVYQEAAGVFSDAYCIQSRLAVQLTNQGRFPEAAPHFRKAYELMPSSFGRNESHCLGCENVFSDPRAREIADEVFEQVVRASPDNPQVHYLAGYLRMKQNRLKDAAGRFRSAIHS